MGARTCSSRPLCSLSSSSPRQSSHSNSMLLSLLRASWRDSSTMTQSSIMESGASLLDCPTIFEKRTCYDHHHYHHNNHHYHHHHYNSLHQEEALQNQARQEAEAGEEEGEETEEGAEEEAEGRD